MSGLTSAITDLQGVAPAECAAAFPSGSAAQRSSSRAIRVSFYLFFPGAGSGTGKYAHEFLRHLARVPGIEPTLACTPGCHWQQFGEYACWGGLREISHDRHWRRRVKFVIGQFVNPRRFLSHAVRTEADIVHFGNINHVSFPSWSSALARCPARKVATVHDVFRQSGLVSPRYDNAQLARFYCAMDALFVHGQQQADQLIAAGVVPQRITIVPHGPYDSGQSGNDAAQLRERYGLPADGQVALAFGNVRDDKNLDLLIRSIERQSPAVNLLVAGRFGSQQRTTFEYCTQLARELGIADRVRFLNRFIDSNEIPDLFKLCDWVALPYSRTFTSQSGVMAVAMQYNRPVLISRVGTAVDVMQKCRIGVGVEPDDLESLRGGVADIQRLVHSAAEFEFERYRREFSWEENARLSVETYRRLLAEDSGLDRPSADANE